MSASADPTAPVKPRYGWVDTAKGGAILLVVLFHATIFLNDLGLAGGWDRLAVTLDTFRMPLFFFTAGLFAPKALATPLRHLFHRRVALLLWVYVLWTAIYTIVFQVVPPGGRSKPTWLDLVLAPFWPNEATWFVYGLALYFLAAWLLRRLPIWAQFAPAIVLTVVFGSNWVNSGNIALDKIAIYFVYFLAAVHAGRFVLAAAERLAWWHALLLVAVYAGAVVVANRAGIFYAPGVRALLGALAIGAGGSVAVMIARSGRMRWLTELGTRTLPVYLLHFYPVLFVCAALLPLAGSLHPWGSLLVPLLTVVAVFVALGVHRVTRRVPGLYALPRPLQRRPTAATSGSGLSTGSAPERLPDPS